MTPERETVDLPALTAGTEAAWKEVEASNLGDRMKRALRRVAGGEGVRESAEAEGYSDSRDLYRYAKRFNLIDARLAAIVSTHRNVAKLGVEEIERRLIEDPDQVKTPALAILTGISTDKAMAYEKLQTDDGASYLSALEKAAARFVEGGQVLELKVSIGPAQSGTTGPHETIDVTPREDQ